MKKYKEFNRRYLLKQLEELKKIKEQLNPNDEKEIEINRLSQEYLKIYLNKSELKDIELDYEKVTKLNNDYLEKNESQLDAYNDYLNNLFDSIQYHDIVKIFNSHINNYYKYDTSFTNHRILEIVHDFYNSIPDKEIRNMFNKEFAIRRKNVRIKGSDTNVNLILQIDKHFITIANDYNYFKIKDFAHEYGHCIQDRISDIQLYINGYYPYQELMSQFFEILALEYTKNFKGCYEKSIITQMDKYLTSFNELNALAAIYNSKDIEFKNEEEYYYYLQNEYDYIIACIVSQKPAKEIHKYQFPYSIIIELLWEYKKDPEKALYKIKQLSAFTGDDYLESLKENDITIGNHVYKYGKYLVKQLEK